MWPHEGDCSMLLRKAAFCVVGSRAFSLSLSTESCLSVQRVVQLRIVLACMLRGCLQGVTFASRIVTVRARCSWPARRETRRLSSTCWRSCHAPWCSPRCQQSPCMQRPNRATPTSCSCWLREAVTLIRWALWDVG